MCSKVNTPPMMAIAIAARVLEWIADQGGLPAMEEHPSTGSTAPPVRPVDRT